MLLTRKIKHRWQKILLFFSIIGPGIITSIADNDAGGIATYSVAGSHFGYNLLWLLSFMIAAMVIIQEMSARLGTVSGKGLADLIRENFGLGWTVLAIVTLLVANISVTISEFAGIAASFELFGLSKYIFVPLIAFLIWFLVVKVPSYKTVERIFLATCCISITYIIAGIIAKPDWGQAAHKIIYPTIILDHKYVFTAIAIIGTTITPWMQFYLQASIVDKGTLVKNYSYIRLDVIIGSLATGIVAFFIIVTSAATLFPQGIKIDSASQAAMALAPLAGNFSRYLFSVGLFSSSVIGAFILPLTTAYAFCEALGFERGVSRDFSSAPVFFSIYTAMIIIGAGTILWPNLPLFFVMLIAQTINGILLPVILLFMLLLINKKEIMGKYINGPIYNTITTATIMVIILFTVVFLFASFLP